MALRPNCAHCNGQPCRNCRNDLDLMRLADDGCPNFPDEREEGTPPQKAETDSLHAIRKTLVVATSAAKEEGLSTDRHVALLRLVSQRLVGRITREEFWERIGPEA